MTTPSDRNARTLVERASKSTVGTLFRSRVRASPSRIAVEGSTGRWTYAELDDRSRRLASVLFARGVRRGVCVASLTENRTEHLELLLAAAHLGAVVACPSWRNTPQEIAYCLELVEPRCVLVSERHFDRLPADRSKTALVFGAEYEHALSAARAHARPAEVDPEDALLVLYTSGTTGQPKGAVVSHRAEIARNLVFRSDLGIAPDAAFVAWPPLFHMGAADCAIGALTSGARVIVLDGFDVERLVSLVGTTRIGWLPLFPGTITAFIAEMRRREPDVHGVTVCGVMADLVSPAEIAELTTLLRAPFANSFGSTETGWPPCSADVIPIGVVPGRLSKRPSSGCEIRLLDAEERDVPDGSPGEMCVRGPTLFSGYWGQPDATARDFRGGWFHMGDVFVHDGEGRYDFVDRVKYLIKTGGENVYPAEIERVLLSDPRVAEAAVVRRRDERWGEVPIAFVARRDDDADVEGVRARCRELLARHKQPADIVLIALDAFPRSASGKIQRHELERLAARLEAAKETTR